MNFEEIEKLEREATKAPWSVSSGCIIFSHLDNSELVAKTENSEFCEAQEEHNAKFIAASRSWVPWAIERIRKLEAVAEAAKNLTSIWKAFDEKNPKDLRGFFELMQKHCDEYGALQIRLRKLEKN